MNYYLDDLRTILSTNNTTYNYTGIDIDSIYVDTLIEPDTITSQNNFVLLYSQGGQSEKVFIENLDFAVYVYNQSATVANDRARTIYTYLHRFTGTTGQLNSVHFRRIMPRQAPMRFNTSVSPVHVFMFTMTADINNIDNTLVS